MRWTPSFLCWESSIVTVWMGGFLQRGIQKKLSVTFFQNTRRY